MNIDRQRVCDEFIKYTDNYDSSETKIKLKIDHTFRVAAISDEIARSLKLSDEDVNLAWFIGMMHDMGRFEQVRRYNTFSDAQSIDHAHFGADLVFGDNLIEKYILDSRSGAIASGSITEEELELIELAVRNHSAYRIQEGLDRRQQLFCNIIRDADKIDILRVNTELPMAEIYNVTEEELKNSEIADEVLNAFYEEHAVLRALKKYPIDHLVGHISLVYELQFPVSLEIVARQGYIYRMIDFQSDNPISRKKFEGIAVHMRQFLINKMSS